MIRPRCRLGPRGYDLGWRLVGVVVTAVINECVASPLTRTVAQAVIIAAVALLPSTATSARPHECRPAPTRSSSPARGAPSPTGRHDPAAPADSAAAPVRDDVHGCHCSLVVQEVLVIAVRDVWRSPSVQRRTPPTRTPAPSTSSAPGVLPAEGLVLGAPDGLRTADDDPSVVRAVPVLERGFLVPARTTPGRRGRSEPSPEP